MASRGQSLTVTYTAWDSGAGAGKPGDVGNHTLRWVRDGTAAPPTNAAAEVDAANCPGLYKITLTAAECACDFGCLAGKSSTAGVSIVPTYVAFENLPTAAPGATGGVAVHPVTVAPAGLDAVQVAGKSVPQTLRYVSAVLAGQVTGAGTGTENFKALDGTAAVTVVVDASGNRPSVTYSG